MLGGLAVMIIFHVDMICRAPDTLARVYFLAIIN